MHRRQSLSRVKIGQNRLNKQNLFYLVIDLCHKAFNSVNLASQLFLVLMLRKLYFTIFAVDKMNRNASWNLNQTASYPLYQCGAVMSPFTMTSLRFCLSICCRKTLWEEQFFKHASCHPTTQFEDFNHVNADATDETKIVTTKFVLGFCHGQLRFCLLVRIGPF